MNHRTLRGLGLTTEWIPNHDRVANRYASTAAEALRIANTMRSDGQGYGWDMILPGSMMAVAPYQNPIPNVYPPVYPPRTVDTVFIAGKTIAEWFSGPPPILPIPPIFQIPDPIIETYTPPVAVPPPGENPTMQITAPPVTVSIGGVLTQLDTLVDLGNAIEAGADVIRDDGSPAVIQHYLGGVLVDGNPLNVLLGQGWIDGQWEAIQAGLATGEVVMPPTQPPSAFPWPWVLAAAGVMLLLRR